MKKYSQIELLEEGFWDRFKSKKIKDDQDTTPEDGGFWAGFKPKNWGKVAKGAIRMGADIARTVAPEITNPLDKLDDTLRGYKTSFKQGYEGIPDPRIIKQDAKTQITSNVATQIYNDIKIGLSGQNMKMIPKFGIEQHSIDPSNGNRLYKVKVSTKENPKGVWMLVDKKGNPAH